MNTRQLRSFIFMTIIVVILSASAAWGNSLNYKGDIVSFFKSVTVNHDTMVRGSIVSIFGDVNVVGAVEGDIVAIFGRVKVEGTVNRDVVSIFGGITVAPRGMIEGNATTVLGHGIVNNGTIRRDTVNILGFFSPGMSPIKILFMLFLLLTVVKEAFVFVMSVVAIVVFPERFERMTEDIKEDPGKKAVIGILLYIGTFILGVILIMTVIGAPIVVLLIPALLLLEFTGATVVKVYVGRKIATSLNKKWTVIMELLLGTVIYTLLELLIIGKLVTFIMKLIGIGEVIYSRLGSGPRGPLLQTGVLNPTKGDDKL